MLNDLLTKISERSAAFRGAPFWAWNGKLNDGELRRQIRMFQEMGMGGFFMHSRVGLATPYLKDEWFDCIRACTDEAKKQGMAAWIYDEDRWPSGAAGGLVTSNPLYRMHFLAVQCGDNINESNSESLAYFALQYRDGQVLSYRRLDGAEAMLREDELRIRFLVEIMKDDSWFNGQSYLDTMNPEAVRQFVKTTHEAYKNEIGEQFGGCIPGIFTDEPNYFHMAQAKHSPWTPRLPEAFQQHYGYDLLNVLPEIFFRINGEEFSSVRLHYFNLLCELFVNSFSRTIGEWCKQNGLLSIGHVLREDFLGSQTECVGSAMRFYEFMQAPGIDLLTEHANIFNAAKQCSSVARQFGLPIRLSETYGCTGWDFPLSGHKALGDWQYALGINFRCLHLAWYTMEGEAKRDYPAAISDQSPWYREYHVVEDYFARLGAALSEGEEVRDLLVIHSIESTWGVYTYSAPAPGAGNRDIIDDDDTQFINLGNQLLGVHLDFDFGDEEIMSRHASSDKGILRINRAVYRAVLLPKLRTIRRTTLELLLQFVKNGGTVVYLGTPPEYLDGVKSAAITDGYTHFRGIRVDEIDTVLSPIARHVYIRDDAEQEISPVLYQLRQGKDFRTLFLCNTSASFSNEKFTMPLVRDRKLEFPHVTVTWKLPEAMTLFELDLADGTIRPVVSVANGNARKFQTSFAPLGSRLFLAAEKDIATASTAAPWTEPRSSLNLAASGWKIELDEPNVLILDMPEWRINNDAWNDATFVLKLDEQLHDILGAAPRGRAMVQPWVDGTGSPCGKLPLELRYSFDCDTPPETDCALALERPELYEIRFNGITIDQTNCGFWVDRSLRKLMLPSALFRRGGNKLLLRSLYHDRLPGLESMFLLGQFGVQNDHVTALPNMLKIGDWCSQGFPYYSGNMTYELALPDMPKDLERIFLEIPDWRGTTLAISINDSTFEPLAWPPYRMDIGARLTEKNNQVKIKVFGHRRNSHGPFFLKNKWPNWTGPLQFKTYETLTRQLVPCGLLIPPRLFF